MLSRGLEAKAQFLRIGTFDFEARTSLAAIYTTNVEGERPSEAEEDREDYYLEWVLSLNSTKQISTRTRLFLDATIEFEKHFIHTDLDNGEYPYGQLGARFITDFDPIQFYGGATWERTSDSLEEIFVPTGLPQQKFQVGTETTYIIGADITFDHFNLGTSYQYTEERFDDEEFSEGENNEAEFSYYFNFIPHRYISLGYKMDRTKTDFINQEDGEGDWINDEELTVDININELFGLFERPKVVYSIGIQREDSRLEEDKDENEGWEIIHNLTISDKFDVSPTLSWDYYFRYGYEDNPEEDDIEFTYGGKIEHRLSEQTAHQLSFRREPIQTFGTTTDTDSTEYNYTITKSDFGFKNVNALLGVGYTIDDPLEGETEKVLDYTARLSHAVQLSRNLTRDLSYEFTREDSNLYDEYLDEHRVTLRFQYTF